MKSDYEGPALSPLRDFDWEKTQPMQFRPFRGNDRYNLTMALENLDPSELILIDNTYKDRLEIRKKIIQQHHDIVVAVNDSSTADPRTRIAVSELYSFIFGTYLPTRYPDIFEVYQSTETKCEIFESHITGQKWPTSLSASTPTIRALEILAQTVDEDFLILLPEPEPAAPSGQPKYILQGYANCYPAGFNTREKLGLRLADIHSPVPGYMEKLERSMDRFFARIEPGRFVKRVSWSITSEAELFAAFGSIHGPAFPGNVDQRIMKPENLKLDQTLLRCERQTLHRLPKSKAVVFGFHTYTYPVRQIKDEGLGRDLAIAIDGLKKGNSPAMFEYKNANSQFLADFSTGRPQKVAGGPDYNNPEFWDDLESQPVRRPRVLHLGLSQLGLKLRDACVERHWNGNGIVNVDFSGEAVRLGQAYESQKPPSEAMHWQRADLLSWSHVSDLLPFAPFDVILDKSTSNAIATATDRHFASTDDLSQICPAVRELLDARPSIALSPVELLGLQLVPLTQKGTTWIVMSYSTFRFGGNSILAQYWTLRSRTPLKAPAGPVSSSAYTPDVFHWIYILDRK
ncbi:hypothetical protein N7494_005097 [Penicillium frequentans]|uniref:Uncharacterized protein n=1 Tax=Penicillium frequentans TaxID=3151616 RepID=A0AAD6CXI3_9EURO|nr:hypothetical protein N7494_005097 [Penicillium glabrum]